MNFKFAKRHEKDFANLPIFVKENNNFAGYGDLKGCRKDIKELILSLPKSLYCSLSGEKNGVEE